MGTRTKIICYFISLLLIFVTGVSVTANNNLLDEHATIIQNEIKTIQRNHQTSPRTTSTLDLAITLAGTNQVRIFLGDGTGGFSNHSTTTVGSFPLALTGDDYNTDGFIDLIATNYDNSTLTVLLGDGTGVFTFHHEYPTGQEPFSILTGDFNNDTDADIAVTHLGESYISIYFGNGDGFFDTPVNYTVGVGPTDITSADVDQDGVSDLIVICDQGEYLCVLLGDGSGGFVIDEYYYLGVNYGSYCITQADFNHDNNVDVAVGCGGYNYVGVFLGDGTGGFGALQNFTVGDGTERFDIITDDFNHDGNDDIAIPNTDENTMSVLLGDGTGSFGTHHVYPVGGYPVGITNGDFDEDGNSDVVVVNALNNTITILFGDGTGGFASIQNMSVGFTPVGVFTADFEYVPVPDLSCSGTLEWTEIKPGATVYGEFSIENSGELDSLLDWEIESYPTWGTWIFTPSSGSDLAAGSIVMVNVTCIAPDEKPNEFSGNITVVNVENSSDYCVIPVYLKTPQITGVFFLQFLERFFTRFPNAFPLLRQLMGY